MFYGVIQAMKRRVKKKALVISDEDFSIADNQALMSPPLFRR
jgi:hypothetical protein